MTRNRFARVMFGVIYFCILFKFNYSKHVNQYPGDPELVNKTLKSGYLCFPALPLALSLHIPAMTPNLYLTAPALNLFLPGLELVSVCLFFILQLKFVIVTVFTYINSVSTYI